MKLMCDFETTTEPFYNKYGYTRVWANCIVDIEQCCLIHIGNSIEDFIKFISNIDDCVCYFHNLKFDGEFIISYLLSNNFRKYERCKKINTYDCIIDNVGVWYMLEININGNIIKIYDSLKKLPFKVKDLAEMLNMKEKKGIIDYDKERPEGYEITQDEKEYIINDCIIVAKALKSLFDKGLKSMTLSGDAQKFFKKMLGGRIYDYHFPPIKLDYDNDIRLSYKGGFVYCNPDFSNKIVKGCSFDVNSLYPSILYNDILPYGYPIQYKGKYKQDKEYPLYIQAIQVDFDLKSGYLPTIQIKHSRFNESEYLKSSNGVVVLWLTNPDLELFLKHYNINFIKYLKGYKFRGTNLLFKKYVDYWYNEKNIGKKENNPTRTMHAKLMLNSLYGRYGMQTLRINKLPYLNNTTGVVEYGLDSENYIAPQYTALASFVCAYGRVKTITASQIAYDQGIYLYSDTDSVHILGNNAPKGFDIDNYKLGAWKNEGDFIGKFIRAKTYIKEKEKNGKKYIELTCAGMPDSIKQIIKNNSLPFDKFSVGATFDGKLIPKRVKGGVILCKTEFTIKI